WRRLLENSLSAKVSCWLIRLLILGSGYNTMISHLGLIRTFPKSMTSPVLILWITVIKELLLMICSCSSPDEFW
ncbi:hypothetical protein ELT41_23645, partial [Escherichia coli]|uniref:hypothetical protein n=1 Tax=Escherichia coli TaxID=562 RepID=UPI001072F49C